MVNIQAYINMATALLVFVGGMVVVFIIPSRLGTGFRVTIALIVAAYFILRMSKALIMLRQGPKKKRSGTLDDDSDVENDSPKTA
jgi:hypothetical protein